MSGKSEQFKGWIEGQAKALRAKCNIAAFARLDPFELARKMEVRVLPPANFSDVNKEMLNDVSVTYGNNWDAGTLTLPDRTHLVVLNAAREPLRQHSTLMEELAHIHLNHKPSQLIDIGGIMLRTWNKNNETQAYAVGSAALLPAYLLKGARTRGYTADEVSEQHQVSLNLVKYRSIVTGIILANNPLLAC